jgi:hypothetical protein
VLQRPHLEVTYLEDATTRATVREDLRRDDTQQAASAA